MCGNFALYSSVKAIKDYHKLLQEIGEIESSYDIRPSQKIPVIVIKQGAKYLGFVRWGLIPFWAKEQAIGYKLINARSETIDVKPSFREAFKKRRCLIPANGFFEWRKPDKTRFFFELKDRKLFSFAGLWEKWQNPQGEIIPSCTIITCSPNDLVASYHDRMPVILDEEGEEIWLNSDNPLELKKILKPCPAAEMKVRRFDR